MPAKGRLSSSALSFQPVAVKAAVRTANRGALAGVDEFCETASRAAEYLPCFSRANHHPHALAICAPISLQS